MIARIRQLYWAKPFRPFTFHLADGQDITVRHPELMALSENTQEVVVLDPDGTHHFINLEMVTKVKLDSKKSSSAN
jgi:hypothetical protein